jgi:hypothetical protein
MKLLIPILLICQLSFGQRITQNGHPVTQNGKSITIVSQIVNADYYVSPTGDDNNEGSQYSPFLTITKAASVVNAGDLVYVRGGTYHEKLTITADGTSGDSIIFREYPGESAIIDGEGHLPAGSWASLVMIEGNYVVFDGFEVKNSNTGGAYTGGAGITSTGLHDVIRKCLVHNTWENGILGQGDYTIIEYCEVYDAAMFNEGDDEALHSSGLTTCRDPQGDAITTGAIIRHNKVHDNWGEGLSTFESNGTLIEDNECYDNSAFDLYVSDAPNTICQRNIVYSVTGGAIKAWAGLVCCDEILDVPRSVNVIVRNNVIYNSSLVGYAFTNTPGTGANEAYFENNTLIDSPIWIGANQGDGMVTTSMYVRNNIIHNSLTVPWLQAGPLTNITLSHNFWSEIPPEDFRGTGDKYGDASVVRTGSTAAGLLTKNYFILDDTSHAINAALVSANVTEDMFGTARDTHPDIGAYESDVQIGHSATLQNGLVAYWPLEESTGAAKDSTETYDGTVTGTTRGVSGKVGNCYQFASSGDRITIPSFDMSSTNKLTLSYWLKTSSSDLAVTIEHSVNSNNYNAFGMDISENYGGVIIGVSHGSMWSHCHTENAYNDGEWHHVVMTVDRSLSTAIVKLYLDGNADYTTSEDYTGDTGNFGNYTLYIGGQSTSTYNFVGYLDEIGVWNRVLTTNEIEDLYNADQGLTYPF